MNEQEAIKAIQNDLKWHSKELKPKYKEVLEYAIKSLEIQDKLKQWIEGYKRQEFADMTLTRDGLIDILEEFRLE